MNEQVINQQPNMDADPYEIHEVTLPMLIRYLKHQPDMTREYDMGDCGSCLLAGFSGEVLGSEDPFSSPGFSRVRGKTGLVPCALEAQNAIKKVMGEDIRREHWTAESLYNGLRKVSA